MGSGYDASKKNNSSKKQKTDLNKTTGSDVESAEHVSPLSDSSSQLSATPQSAASFNAQELLGNQQVAEWQLDSMQAATTNFNVDTITDHEHMKGHQNSRAVGIIPSLEDEEFWGQLFGGDPAPADPRNKRSTTSEVKRIPWLGGWVRVSDDNPEELDTDNIEPTTDPTRRASALNRWAPNSLFESKSALTLEATINLQWYHPINQAITTSRFLATHINNPACVRLASITGPFPNLSTPSSLLGEIDKNGSRTLAAQTAISLSLASSSIEIACDSHNSNYPDIAASILMCAPIARQLLTASSPELRKKDADTMFKKEAEHWCEIVPRLGTKPKSSNTKPTGQFIDDLGIVRAALCKVMGVIHIPTITDPFRVKDKEERDSSSAVAELDAILAGSNTKPNSGYKLGTLITETLKFTQTVSSIRYSYTKLALAVWLSCGPSNYDALVDSLKLAMTPLKLIARAAQINLRLIERSIDSDLGDSRKHFESLSVLRTDLRIAVDTQVEDLARIAVCDSTGPREHGGSHIDIAALLCAIDLIEKGEMQSSLETLSNHPLSTETTSEYNLLQSTLHLALLFGTTDRKATESLCQSTLEMAEQMKAPFHTHFAKIIVELIRQVNKNNST